MDLEAVQLLNLSPIPELSEIELSTMLEQLSGLSDLNGDLTDRNVEDIIKEAEDLLDRSYNSGINQSVSVITNSESNDQAFPEMNQNKSEECEEKTEPEKKHYNTPIKGESLPQADDVPTLEAIVNSPVEKSPIRIFSPGSSANPIKSTIDSLKEFSTLIEKKLSSRSGNSSPPENTTKKKLEFEKNLVEENQISNTSKTNEKTTSSSKSVMKSPQLNSSDIKKKAPSESRNMDKSIKLMNCFERLYQDRPIRLSASNKKPKMTDKVSKTIVKKKYRDLKSSSKEKKVLNKVHSQEKKTQENETKGNEKDSQKVMPSIEPEIDYSTHVEEWLRISKVSSGYPFPRVVHPPDTRASKNEESKNELKPPNKNPDGGARTDSSIIDEKLILRLLQEMEEIKDQVKKAGIVPSNEGPEKLMKESQAVINRLKSEVESAQEKVSSEALSNPGIQRLEEQFSLLKNKYDQHLEKLEAENLKLREALSNQQRYTTKEISTTVEEGIAAETNNHQIPVLGISSSSGAGKKLTRNLPLENSLTPKNSPRSILSSSPKEVQASATLKEAFSQTEKELRNISIQCVQEEKAKSEDGISQTDFAVESLPEDKRAVILETRKAENKENVSLKKKLGKGKPFSDLNAHQLMKQKKVISEHETQLLATLRGLQAEVTLKDKETRKLKTEIDLLKTQIKRLTRNKVEGCKKSHTGTQTIGLGPAPQRPYNPEIYEVPNEFEKENEELKLRVIALEEDFELLKEKRINDLQALHQVHEEEMAKLVSKLETQSALTKHLHSLLVNR